MRWPDPRNSCRPTVSSNSSRRSVMNGRAASGTCAEWRRNWRAAAGMARVRTASCRSGGRGGSSAWRTRSRWTVVVDNPVDRASSLMPSSGRRPSKHRRIATARSMDCTPLRRCCGGSASTAGSSDLLTFSFLHVIPPFTPPDGLQCDPRRCERLDVTVLTFLGFLHSVKHFPHCGKDSCDHSAASESSI